MSEPLLRVEKLSVEFKKFKALTDMDLTVNEGEVRVVIGPNGAGKSTQSPSTDDSPTGRGLQPPTTSPTESRPNWLPQFWQVKRPSLYSK